MVSLFRVENQSGMQDLWYDAYGNFRPLVTRLTDGKAHEMPMGFDPDFDIDERMSKLRVLDLFSEICGFSLGNAVVPMIPELIGRAIIHTQTQETNSYTDYEDEYL